MDRALAVGTSPAACNMLISTAAIGLLTRVAGGAAGPERPMVAP